ncbi:solute symporter family protein [Oceanobacillus senegalensis]|uniref:solute symporter family protein n=1 Tax=Oceanobacillus senegalensis TaxID=1936063 RepID=UPI001C4F4C9B|nr:cation acetate symporter [Oceanobacillus senegalensis]
MNLTYFIFFLAIVIGTLTITHWAAERSKTTHQFYVAAGSLTGYQNGLAIAGDYISAASFLGITGLVAFYGYDGFLYATGFLVSYVILLLLIAEPVQKLSIYSLGDVIAARFPGKKIRFAVAMSGIIISVLYMIPQLVASGLLIRLLLDVDYAASVWIIGILMTIYVVFGGMVATSWVQIIKTVLLMAGSLLLVFILLSRLNWDFSNLIGQVIKESERGEQFFYAGNLFQHPIERLSLLLSLILGTSGLPHILIRFLTVKNAVEVRTSVLSATWIIGFFYIITLVLGLGTITLVGWDKLMVMDETGNLAALLLADVLGGDFLVAFVMAVAFATIIAVVTGLVFTTTSLFAHDIYFHILKNKKSSEKEQLRIARITAVVMGFLSIALSLGMEDINVAFLVSLTFSVASSTIFPLLFLTFYWKRFTHMGAYFGLFTGFFGSFLLVTIGPEGFHIFPLYNPGIVTIPCTFISAIIGSLLSRMKQSKKNEDYIVRIHL